MVVIVGGVCVVALGEGRLILILLIKGVVVGLGKKKKHEERSVCMYMLSGEVNVREKSNRKKAS